MEKWMETKTMKLTKETLKRIIKEELNSLMNEDATDNIISVIRPLLKQFFPNLEFRAAPHPKFPKDTVIYSGKTPYVQIMPNNVVAVFEKIYDNVAISQKIQKAVEEKGIEYRTSIENL